MNAPPARRGAPRGNRNAFKHGLYSAERLALLADIRAHIKLGKILAEDVHSNLPRSSVRCSAVVVSGSCEQKGIILAPRLAPRLIRPAR